MSYEIMITMRIPEEQRDMECPPGMGTRQEVTEKILQVFPDAYLEEDGTGNYQGDELSLEFTGFIGRGDQIYTFSVEVSGAGTGVVERMEALCTPNGWTATDEQFTFVAGVKNE